MSLSTGYNFPGRLTLPARSLSHCLDDEEDENEDVVDVVIDLQL